MQTDKQRQERIKQEAVAIIDNFYNSLVKSDMTDVTVGVKREKQTRNPKRTEANSDFKSAILRNAPLKDDDYILAEKKKW